jgi:hypothetical protein
MKVMQKFGIKDRPYEDYDILKWYVWKYNNFTCQECGYKSNMLLQTTYGCVLMPDWYDPYLATSKRHPSFCMGMRLYPNEIECTFFKGIVVPKIDCEHCPFFAIYFFEDYNTINLVMHHIDSNPCNNEKSNLTTLCNSCNNLGKYKKTSLHKLSTKTMSFSNPA